MSQLLQRIEQELHTETDAVRRAELMAKRGGYLARVGRFAEARQIVADLRQVFGDGRSGRTTVWIMLTEGLLYLFEKLSPSAIDRISRAQVLGIAMKDRELIAIASAWKAHIEFETSQFDSMTESLKIAIANASADDHDARARMSMVLCDVFLLCGDRGRAQKWFSLSREHALSAGDQASIEALLYNRAAFSLAWLRAQRCLGDISEDDLSLTRLEISSARNLQNLTRVAALTNFVHLCDARLLILEGNFAAAIKKLDEVRVAGPFADYNFSQSFVDLEVAYCLHRLERCDESLAVFERVRSDDYSDLDVDEQLVAAWMFREMAGRDCRYGDGAAANLRLEQISTRYLELVKRVKAGLESFHDAN